MSLPLELRGTSCILEIKLGANGKRLTNRRVQAKCKLIKQKTEKLKIVYGYEWMDHDG